MGIGYKNGCDFNSYRRGERSFFSNGADFQHDTSKSMTVGTQLLTHDGSDTGDLAKTHTVFTFKGQGGPLLGGDTLGPERWQLNPRQPLQQSERQVQGFNRLRRQGRCRRWAPQWIKARKCCRREATLRSTCSGWTRCTQQVSPRRNQTCCGAPAMAAKEPICVPLSKKPRGSWGLLAGQVWQDQLDLQRHRQPSHGRAYVSLYTGDARFGRSGHCRKGIAVL